MRRGRGARADLRAAYHAPAEARPHCRARRGHGRAGGAGRSYDDAADAAARDEIATGATRVPAFDHPRTIAGQGTVLREAVQQLDAVPDVVVVPVGGGGLLAGTLGWLGERHPEVRVVGVEPAGATCMATALNAGKPVALAEIDGFVDGAAVRRAGDITYPLVRDGGAELVSLPEGQVCCEMLAMYQSDGIIAEPAGALAAAALGTAIGIAPGVRVLCVVSGGNNDVSRYGEVVERALDTRAASTTSSSTSRRNPARCAAFSTRCSAPTTTSPCSSTSSATTAKRGRRWSPSSSAVPMTSLPCSNGCSTARPTYS